jgi:hypothetical protein
MLKKGRREKIEIMKEIERRDEMGRLPAYCRGNPDWLG